MFKKLLRQNFIFIGFAIGIFLSLTLFYKSFTTYYFQDDWFSLRISNISSFAEFLSFFKPRSDIIYYRPLGMQVPFFISQTLFGLNPLFFRLITFMLHIFNSWLVYKILNYILKNKKLAIVGFLFYATASSNLTIFYWAATFAFVLAPALYFGSFYAFLKNKHLLSWTLFLIGLFTNELLVTLPIILTIWELINRKFQYKKIFSYWLVLILYLILRLRYSYLPLGGSYSVVVNIFSIVKTLKNYWLWMWQWPEETANQFLSFFTINPLFVKIHPIFNGVFISNLLIGVFGLLILPFIYLIVIKKFNKRILMLFLFGIVWWMITLLPVLFFSQHAFAYYLAIPFFGILLTALILYKYIFDLMKSNKFTLFFLVVIYSLWYIGAVANVKFNLIYHWAPRRSTISKVLVNQIKTNYPFLSSNSVIVLPINKDKTNNNQWALGDEEALKIIYHDSSIRTIYAKKDEELKTLLMMGIPGDNVFIPTDL